MICGGLVVLMSIRLDRSQRADHGRNRTMTIRISMLASVALLAFAAGVPAQAQQAGGMSFFVTSAGPGKGADLGGLAGADAHCAKLAQAAGSNGKTWHAYLSTQGSGAVN